MGQRGFNVNLDVGCFRELRGDINVDIHIPDVRFSKMFIKADGCHLPFKDQVFDEVTCFHLIEHNNIDPFLLMKELLRVTKIKLLVKCPYRFGGLAKGWDHKHYFNIKWFKNLLDKWGMLYHIRVNLDSDRTFFKLPFEITARIWKRRK